MTRAGSETLVSVILPTFNRAWCIRRAMQSVLAQTHKHLELIVVDDASTDDTAGVVGTFQDPRVRYLRCEKNQGVSAARNLGVEKASGELVAFQDSDDEWRVEKLERQLDAVEHGGPDTALVVCGNLCVNHYAMSYLGVDSSKPVVDATEMTLLRIPGAPCWLLRRSSFVAVGGFDTELDCFEDWELALRLSAVGRVLMVNEPLHLFQSTPRSLFSTEENHARNLQRILGRHGERLRRNSAAWSTYCNLLGQQLCKAGAISEGRSWFLDALRHEPVRPRSWANLTISFLGARAFRRYVDVARVLRARVSAPVRPSLPDEKS